MAHVSVAQAVKAMEELLDQAKQGQEVVIIGKGGAAFKVVALPRTPSPVFGSAKGQVHIGEDFDEPVEGFEEYMP